MYPKRFDYTTPPEDEHGWEIFDRWTSSLTHIARAVDRDMAEKICEALNNAE